MEGGKLVEHSLRGTLIVELVVGWNRRHSDIDLGKGLALAVLDIEVVDAARSLRPIDCGWRHVLQGVQSEFK